MGLLDSIQNTLFKQSSINQRFQAQKGLQDGGMAPVEAPSGSQVTRPSMPNFPTPVAGGFSGIGKSNPFLISSELPTLGKTRHMGENKPLEQPMFIGYHNEKPIYGGGQIFLLA
ncbi:MAG: hypothetical protein ACK551_03560 [Vampirovibrionales bacterium]|jgi:hypothetical protein